MTHTEALDRARAGQSVANYPAIFAEFESRGIPAAQIKPRENVLTFNAWRALGRTVKRGERGVKITTYVEVTRRNPERPDGPPLVFRRPRTATVFHVSQTTDLFPC